MSNLKYHKDPMKCECLYWAETWTEEEIKENKHHPNCEYYDST